jgi:hypothetical protein
LAANRAKRLASGDVILPAAELGTAGKQREKHEIGRVFGQQHFGRLFAPRHEAAGDRA